MTKSDMRAVMKKMLNGLDPRDLSARSARIARNLVSTRPWKESQIVLCFLSMPAEVDTSFIIKEARAAGKTVAVPRIHGDAIRFLILPVRHDPLPRGSLGIPEPDPSWPEIDMSTTAHVMVVAPGLAFDRRGNRLGRGKGFYDQFLCRARTSGPARMTVIGVCLSEQLLEEVPHDSRDQLLDGIVTEAESISVLP